MNVIKSICVPLLTASVFISNANAAGNYYLGASAGVGGYKAQPGYIGNIFGGYGTRVGETQKFYLGGELNVHIAHYNYYMTTYGIGAFFMPGLMITNSTMLYAKLGIDTTYLPKRAYEFQTQAGLGMQTALTQKVDLRGEFVSGGNTHGASSYNLGLVYKFG